MRNGKEHNIFLEAERFARELLSGSAADSLRFHRIEHTAQVVRAAQEIGEASNLSEEEMHLVILAAWMHDLGYVRSYQNHEDASKEIAREFLAPYKLSEAQLSVIMELIDVTRPERKPNSLIEAVIKDADMHNLGTADGLTYTALLREEWAGTINREYDDVSWYQLNLAFYRNQPYYTEYAHKKYEPGKTDNVLKLEKKLMKARKLQMLSGKEATSPGANEKIHPEAPGDYNSSGHEALRLLIEGRDDEIKKLKKKLKKTEEKLPGRGVETMFRTTYRTHTDLSGIADNKANLLLSINAIIISIVTSSIIRQIIDHPMLIWPTIILLTVCMTTIVFAILATRPKVSSGKFSQEDVLNRRANLLFFGNYFKMSLEDYQMGIKALMHDPEYVYSSMAKDLYFLGVVLGKKFRYLRIAYTIFMYGLLIAVACFALTFWLESRDL